jgi:hypothetical protein
MAIYKALGGLNLPPEKIGQMQAAYETALRLLELSDRESPICDLVCKHVIELAETGVDDVATLAMLVVAKVRRHEI